MRKVTSTKKSVLLNETSKEPIGTFITNIFRGSLELKKIYSLWNRFSEEYGLVKCSFTAESLDRKIRKNLKELDPDTWRTCFEMIQKSTWLHDKGWFTLSWLMKLENFTKVHDGAYSRSSGESKLPTNAVGTRNSVDKMMKDWREKKR